MYWIIGIILVAVAGVSIWFAAQRLLSWQSLGELVAVAVKAALPSVTKRLPEKEEAVWRDSYLKGKPDRWNKNTER